MDQKKRDLRIVFTGSCADLLRHGLLMLMFLDGTCQASEPRRELDLDSIHDVNGNFNNSMTTL
jgi:hypothetical protein